MRVGMIVAGGTGERFGRAGGKQLVEVGGRPIATHSVLAFAAATTIDSIVLVCPPDRLGEYRAALVPPELAARVAVVPGGATRRHSVAAGLAALPDGTRIVAVHDGARPLLLPGTIDRAVAALESSEEADGVVVGHPAYDTIKQVDGAGAIVSTPDRSALWVAQTPQVFRADVLRAAHARAAEEDLDVTDDAAVVEHIGGTVFMLEGPRWNLKVTVPEDLEVVETLLALHRDGGR